MEVNIVIQTPEPLGYEKAECIRIATAGIAGGDVFSIEHNIGRGCRVAILTIPTGIETSVRDSVIPILKKILGSDFKHKLCGPLKIDRVTGGYAKDILQFPEQ